MCGARIDSLATDGENYTMTGPSRMNVLIREETDRRSTLRVEFSDRAVESLAAPLNLILTGQGSRRLLRGPEVVGEPRVLAPPPAASDSDDSSEMIPDSTEGDGHAQSTVASQGSLGLQDVFRRHGETFKLDYIYLKARNKGDYTKRLTYLFLLAHLEAGRDLVPRSDLTCIWDETGINDGNARGFLSRDGDLDVSDRHVRMRTGARMQANAFLRELSDTRLDDGWYPGKEPRQRRVRDDAVVGDSPVGGDKHERSGSKRKTAGKPGRIAAQVGKWSAAWKQSPLVSNAHGIFRDRPAYEQALFGLWVIRKLGDEENPIVSTQALARLLETTPFELKVTESGLRAALQRSGDKEVLHPGGVHFQITQTGMEHVENILGPNQVP